jgi:hypothetical protein
MAGCSSAADRIELPQSAAVTLYQPSWEYRYGDSPLGSDGNLEWAEPGFDDGGWRRTPSPQSPPGRGRAQYLWLRSRLAGPPLHDPVLLLEDVELAYEAFLDGRPLARFGQLDGFSSHRSPGRRQHYLALGDSYVGRVLTLRIASPLPAIGIWGGVRLGGRAELLVDVVRRGLPPLIIGMLIGMLGLASLSLYFVQRSERSYLLYGVLSLVMGIYMVARSPLRSFLFEEPVIWYHLELSSLCLTGAAACGFISLVLGDGPLRILRWLVYSFLLLFAVTALLVGSGRLLLPMALRPLQYLWLATALALVVTASRKALRGDTDARIFALGMLATTLLIMIELVQAMGIVPRHGIVVHYSAMTFMLALGIIMVRRVGRVHKRLSDFSTVLQLNFSSAEALAPGQHVQIALEEMLRMLEAERGLLFLCQTESHDPASSAANQSSSTGESSPQPLALAAGRDIRGSVLHELPASTDHDHRLISQVLSKRRPLIREFRPTTVSMNGASMKRSVVAAPLLARGQLLGVLYLEADANRRGFVYEDMDILLGLGSQVALMLLAARAVSARHVAAA